MFLAIISPNSYSVLKQVKCPPFLFSQLKQLNLAGLQVFWVNGALTGKEAAHLTSSVD